MNTRLFLTFFLGIWGILSSGCDTGIKTLEATEYGIRFRRLPTYLGGGVASQVLSPGNMVIVWPWDVLYRVDTAVKEVSWGPNSRLTEGSTTEGGYLRTRARDGNELALAVTIRYQVSSRPEDLLKLVDLVADSEQSIEDLVVSIARADVRHYLNELRTIDFIDPTRPEARIEAVERLRASLGAHLQKYFVEIVNVNLDEYRFERFLAAGKVDDTYQETLDHIQRIAQDIEREEARKATVVAEKQSRFNEAKGVVNRLLAEAQGELAQARVRGDKVLEIRQNEAQAILVKGQSEAEGLRKSIDALAGKGGREILKLAIGRQVLASQPSYAVVERGAGGAGDLALSRIEMGDVLSALGLFAMDSGVKARGSQNISTGPDVIAGDIRRGSDQQATTATVGPDVIAEASSSGSP